MVNNKFFNLFRAAVLNICKTQIKISKFKIILIQFKYIQFLINKKKIVFIKL